MVEARVTTTASRRTVKDYSFSFGLAFATAFILIAVVFWPARYDLPRGDQINFLLEKNFITSWGEWARHAIFNTRSRLIDPGDLYLFRPIMMALQWCLDVIVTEDLPARFLIHGLASFLMFGVLVTVTFWILRRWWPLFAAGAVAVWQISNGLGDYAVTWRHITPYLLAPACMAAGFLVERPLSRRGAAFVFFLWFAAFGMHDYAFWTGLPMLLILGVAALFVENVEKRQWQRDLALMAVAWLVMAAMNAADYFVHRPGYGPGFKTGLSLGQDWVSALQKSIQFGLGTFMGTVWAPWVRGISPFPDAGIHQHAGVAFLCGLVASGFLILAVARLLRTALSGKFQPLDGVAAFALLGLLVLVVSVGLLRSGGTYHDLAIQYYGHLFVFHWVSIAAYGMGGVVSRPRGWVIRSVGVLFVLAAVPNAFQVWQRARDGSGPEVPLAVSKMVNFLRSQRAVDTPWCLASQHAAAADGKLMDFTPFDHYPRAVNLLSAFLPSWTCGQSSPETVTRKVVLWRPVDGTEGNLELADIMAIWPDFDRPSQHIKWLARDGARRVFRYEVFRGAAGQFSVELWPAYLYICDIAETGQRNCRRAVAKIGPDSLIEVRQLSAGTLVLVDSVVVQFHAGAFVP